MFSNKFSSTAQTTALSSVLSVYRGETLTPGTTVKSAWTQVGSSTNLGKPCVGIEVNVTAGSSAGTSRKSMIDIGVDPAGGTAYESVVQNIACGGASHSQNGAAGARFYFPLSIPTGASVAVRGISESALPFQVWVGFYTGPVDSVNSWCGTSTETIGATGLYDGTTFTPGGTTKGSWATLGTTLTNLKYWQMGIHIGNTAIVAQIAYIDLAYGDATNKKLIFTNNMFISHATSESYSLLLMPYETSFCDVPAGSTIYIRAASTTASPGTGWNAVAIGIGG